MGTGRAVRRTDEAVGVGIIVGVDRISRARQTGPVGKIAI
jgi:hypothetical protein